MSKFKLKDGANAKSVVRYRVPGRAAMARVELGEATDAQLAVLHKLGHHAVLEVKPSGVQEVKAKP